MKKLLSLLIGLMLVILPFSALAAAPAPKPFVVFIKFDGTPVPDLNVGFTCGEKTVTKITNEIGGVMIDVGSGSPDFSTACVILEVDCGYDSCRESYNVGSMDCPECKYTFELSEAPPEPEPECLINSDCPSDYECINENCELIPVVVEDKVSSNTDGTIASVESNFGECIDVIITDTKLTKLFDGIIDFDTEDYDVHEELRVKACSKTSLDDVDYGLEPHVLIEEGAVEYRYVFDDTISFSKEDEEELEINFLGKDIEIISLSSSKLIIRHGEVFDDEDGCIAGKEITYNGLPLRIISISEDSIYVSYNGENNQINKDDIDDVGGIQIYVDIAAPNANGDDYCAIRIAEDIEEIIEDGIEYNEEWEYSKGEGYVGLRNREEFKYLDEENKPLTLGDKITLPNDFAVIKFNEITDSETTDIDIKIREGMFNVFGDREDEQDDSFTFNNQDYDELYVGAEGILDKDQVFISNKVRIGESNVYLEKGSIIIGDLTIELDFLDILYKGISYALDDDNYLAYEGIIFKNPEKSVKDGSTFNVIVPDEIPEIVITIGAESETVGIEPEPEVCPECTEEDCATIVCETCTPCEACEECPECPEIPEGLTGGQILIYIISILGIGGIGTYAGKKLTGDRISKIKNVTYRVRVERDGDIVEEHRHAGIRTYHSINTSHRETHERHPKGERYPLYEKDEIGTYNYVG